MSIKSASFFTKAETEKILEAIKAAERNSSGEIRVHIESKHSDEDPVERARKIFVKLKMHLTKDRNGILFYLSTVDRKFAVIGDRGIDAIVHDSFWVAIKDTVLEKFKQGLFAEGLIEGIIHCGASLKEYFPYLDADKNELDDAINFG